MAAKEPVAKGSRATSALTKASFLGEPGKQLVNLAYLIVSQARWRSPLIEQAGEALYMWQHLPALQIQEIFSPKAFVLQYLISRQTYGKR